AAHRPIAADDLVLRETGIGTAHYRTAGLTDDEVPRRDGYRGRGVRAGGLHGDISWHYLWSSDGFSLIPASVVLSAQRSVRRGFPRAPQTGLPPPFGGV